MDKAKGEIMLLLASIDPIHRGFEYERWPPTRRPRHTMKFKQGLDQQWIPKALTPR
jgi:hypothetical protein